MKIILILSTAFLLGSCAFHSGSLTSVPTTTPVIYKDLAIGVATSNLFLGLGGVSKDALVFEARKNMVGSRPLNGPEQYNNITVDVKTTYYILGRRTKVTMIADVVEPKQSVNQPTYTEEYQSQMGEPTFIVGLHAVGDTVFCGKYDKGKILRFIVDGGSVLAEIAYLDNSGDLRTKRFLIDHIFSVREEYRGLTLGSKLQEGVIIGFGETKILVAQSFDMHYLVSYPED